MASKFIHLHTHSHYSLLTALPKIDDLVKLAKKYEMPALALTDNANLYGAIEFYKACKKAEIKPIIGIDAYVAGRLRTDKQAGVDNRRSRLILIAKDQTGYKNLVQLVTAAHLEGFYYKPRIDKELIEKFPEGLVCISPSFSGAISFALKMKDYEKARELIAWYKKVYGAENFFLELTYHPEIPQHQDLMAEIKKIAKETDTPLVAAHDVYYLAPDDRLARNTLMMVQSSGELRDSDDDGDFSFISGTQAEEFFKDTPEAIENTQKIADMCNLSFELGKWVFPNFIVESGRSYDDELKALAYEGIDKRGLPHSDEVMKRLDYELQVIKDKGYPQYFLVVSDLLKYAHDHGILTNIRGSVAGSLTTYVTGITNVDPLEYKLPFERFLNPQRPSAPDIDMDYADNRRDEIINYARQKYGVDKVAQIGTFGTMMAKGAVRDVARAMGYPYSVADGISKLIPMGAQGFPMTIDRALEEVAELKQKYEGDEDTRKIIDMAKKIEGCARHMGVHAAGVVIAPRSLVEYVPLQFDPKGEGKIITQYDMHAVGEDGIGLLKFDFLGIKNLSILADAIDRVRAIDGKIIDIETIPLDDQKTFDMLARGETIGLFQLNGTGMTRFLVELKPSTIHDINAMVALYRPGPLESIPQYIERKHDASKIQYLDPRMKTILDRSYGVITYQDDVMMIAIELAGYSWLEADKLRKAMGKKIPKEMEEQKGKLMDGLAKKGMSPTKTKKLWALIEPFAAYGFNKAHAASYGRVAYQTAYMKANYPAIYMSAVLTADSGDVEKIGEFITECKRMGIPVLPPDINESYSGFTVVKVKNPKRTAEKLATENAATEPEQVDAIRFGLTTIKNFGESIGKAIIDERKANGKFKSLTDFLNRIKDKNLNKKSLESLVKAGALDAFGERGQMLGNTEDLLKYNKEKMSEAENQDSLFGATLSPSAELRMRDFTPATQAEKLFWEKELLGLYVSGHPLDKFREILDKRDMSIKKAKETLKDGAVTVLAGIIEETKMVVTKKGDNMMFLKIADFTSSMEIVIFPRTFTEFKNILQLERCVAIKGKMSERNGTQSMLAEKVKGL